jgi:hypothetical protein
MDICLAKSYIVIFLGPIELDGFDASANGLGEKQAVLHWFQKGLCTRQVGAL